MTKQSLASLVVAGVVAGSISFWFQRESGASSGGRPDPVSSPAAAAPAPLPEALSEIESALARIEARLSRLESGPTRSAVEEPSTDASAPTQLKSIAATLARLEASLASHVEDARKGSLSPGTLEKLKAAHPEPKWSPLGSLIATWHRDEKQALAQMQLLTVQDVITKYGSATEVWNNEQGLNWLYGLDVDPVGGYHTEVWLRFNDGYVTMLGVKDN